MGGLASNSLALLNLLYCNFSSLQLDDTSAPVLIFTNTHISDAIEKKIHEDLKADILHKQDHLPFELAEEIQDILAD